MKLTKGLLEQYIREAFQQKLFGGEEVIKAKAAMQPAPEDQQKQINYLSYRTNDKFDRIYGRPMIKRFYRLHRNYETDGKIPEIVEIQPMRDKTIHIHFDDGTLEVYTPYNREY